MRRLKLHRLHSSSVLCFRMIEELTPSQEKRQEFAERLVDLIYEMDDLLIQEYNEEKPVPRRDLNEMILRKLHVGGVPYAIRRTPDGLFEPNPEWVLKGYLNMDLFDYINSGRQ